MARNRKLQNQGLSPGVALKAALLCGLIVTCCVGYVWQKKQIHELSKQIRNAENRRDELHKNNEKLQKQLAELLTPLALEARVKELKLGLALPQPNQIWRLAEPADDVATGVTNGAQIYAAKRSDLGADEH